jgi:hypothetical protein
MSNDGEAARIERARRLREELDALVERGGAPLAPESPGHHESPRDFIHRKMQELEETVEEEPKAE